MRLKFKDNGHLFWAEDEEKRFRVRKSIWMDSIM